MRKIEQQMLYAIQQRKNWQLSNTQVTVHGGTIVVRLHGNIIAEITSTALFLSDAGWRSSTTKSRLNAILQHYKLPLVYQKQYQWYIGDELWTGSKKYKLQELSTCL